jgi:hypothetical protein
MNLLAEFRFLRTNNLVGVESVLQPMELLHLDHSRFHVWRRGAGAPILYCNTHLIVRADLASHLINLCPGYIFGVVANLKQVATGESYDDYLLLKSAINKRYIVANQNRLWNFQGGHLRVLSIVGRALYQASRPRMGLMPSSKGLK